MKLPAHWPTALLFGSGKITALPSALAVAAGEALADYVMLHCSGEFGEATGQTATDNLQAIERGAGQVTSAYQANHGTLIVITLLSAGEPFTMLYGLHHASTEAMPTLAAAAAAIN